jgi:hypothetical protein
MELRTRRVFGWWQDYVNEIGWLEMCEFSLAQRGPLNLVDGVFNAPETQDAVAGAGSPVIVGA